MVDFRGAPFQEAGAQDFATREINPVSENREHSNSVDALSANPVNRSHYASGSHDHTIKVWDANTHRCVSTIRGHTDGVWALDYLTDGRKMISASVDGTARLWDVNSGQNTATLAYHENKVYDAAVNQDMTMACTVSSDKKIAVWDLRNTQQPMLVNADDTRDSVTCCDFSADQKAVITATFGGRVVVLDLES